MALLMKCLIACAIMIGIDQVSNTANYFMAGLMLSFPGLSMVAYYFLAKEGGKLKVINTTTFACLSLIPFAIFLMVLHGILKRTSFAIAMTVAFIAWLLAAIVVVACWQRFEK